MSHVRPVKLCNRAEPDWAGDLDSELLFSQNLEPVFSPGPEREVFMGGEDIKNKSIQSRGALAVLRYLPPVSVPALLSTAPVESKGGDFRLASSSP